MNLVAPQNDGPAISAVSPYTELGAYEALWLEKGATFKRIAEKFASDPTAMPSDFVLPNRALECAAKAFSILKQSDVHRFGIRIHHAGEYPVRLRDAKYPVEMLYYQGAWELSELPSVAVVGTRKPSDEGVARTRRLVRELVAKKYVVVSGLASGVDTTAHTTAIEEGGNTIAVIGTPLGQYYPRENRDLQNRIASNFLLISQIPLLRYLQQDYRSNRAFFPERNATMSALTKATIIVEASNTSGTLTQAKAALFQGRKLFILDSCFRRPDIDWPAKFEAQGAIRVREPADIWSNLK